MSTISLLKKNVGVILEKKKLNNVVARVGLVLDISGSMRNLYRNGTVQKVVERILAVASQFDDDGQLDVFINDGGCKKTIKKPVVSSSNKPIFWQFVGIGDSNFEVLKKLDEMEGRFIDNANFFHIQDIEKISDDELYNKLLHEFPSWLQEAKEKGVL